MLYRATRCEICGTRGKTFNGKNKSLHIDHCHVTGKVRGVLCPECNHMLGKAKDNPVLLRRAADYLEES